MEPSFPGTTPPPADVAAAGQPTHRPGSGRIATAALFYTAGAVFGTWVPRIPEIKDRIGIGTGALGLALFGSAVGALLSKQVAGQLVGRRGSRFTSRIALVLIALALPMPALAGDIVALSAALFGFGVANGILDVAMNAHAVRIEERLGRPVMSSYHGVYSVGGLTGAVLGGQAGAAGVPVVVHFGVAAVVLCGGTLLASARLLPPEADRAGRTVTGDRATRLPPRLRLPLILLGLVGLCSLVGEGAVGDWSAIYLREDLAVGAGLASAGFAAYSIAMAAGRFLGDRLIGRWGEIRVVTWSASTASVGFALALVIDRPAAAIAGFAVLGAGLSVVVPVVFSMAGRLGGDAAGPSIGLVSMLTGTGFLAGPPLIGLLAEGIGLPAALGAVTFLVLLGIVLLRVATHVAGHRAALTRAGTARP